MSIKAQIRRQEKDMATRLLVKLDEYARKQSSEYGLPLSMEGDVALMREIVWSETDEIGERAELQTEANMLAWLVNNKWPDAAAAWKKR